MTDKQHKITEMIRYRSNRLFLRQAEKKQTVAQTNDKSSLYRLNLAQICDRQPFFLRADTRGGKKGKIIPLRPNPL